MRFIGLLLLLLQNLAAEESPKDTHDKDHIFQVDGDNCPRSFLEWSIERNNLRAATRVSAIFAFGRKLELCSKKPDQAPLFNDGQFLACMNRIRSITDISLEKSAKEIVNMNSRAKLPPEVYKLPAPFQNVDFWIGLQEKDEAKIKETIAQIKKANPKSVTFKYVSHFKPNGHFFITYWPDSFGERFIHFDDELEIIMLSKVTKDYDGKDYPSPVYILGDLKDVLIFNNDGSPQKPLKDLIIASALTGSIKSDQASCYSCHQSGVMPVLPIDKSPTGVTSYDSEIPSDKILNWFNTTHAKPDETGFSQLLANVPVLGTASPHRNLDFVKQCSDLKSDEAAKKVLSSMSCVKCHDGSVAPGIKFPFGHTAVLFEPPPSSTTKTNKETVFDLSGDIEENPELDFSRAVIDIVLREGHMPPKANNSKHKNFLSPEERKALKDCLLTEYLGKMYPEARKRNVKHNGLLLDYLLELECPK